jgi:hypothetical protein
MLARITGTALARQYQALNPARLRRDLTALQDQLLRLAADKEGPRVSPVVPTGPRAQPREATNPPTRAS